MTNLIATITFTLTTNWATVSRTSPVIPESEINFAVYRPVMSNQTGVVKSNTVANVQWNGKTIPVVVESVDLMTLSRSVDEKSGYGITWGKQP